MWAARNGSGPLEAGIKFGVTLQMAEVGPNHTCGVGEGHAAIAADQLSALSGDHRRPTIAAAFGVRIAFLSAGSPLLSDFAP